jgi:hypothetical protein
MFWAERPEEPTMYRRLLLLTCLAAALFVAPAAEAAPERRIDLAAAPYLAAAASAPAPVVAVECVQARAALHHGSRRKAICLVWTFDRSGEPGDHCLDAHVRAPRQASWRRAEGRWNDAGDVRARGAMGHMSPG